MRPWMAGSKPSISSPDLLCGERTERVGMGAGAIGGGVWDERRESLGDEDEGERVGVMLDVEVENEPGLEEEEEEELDADVEKITWELAREDFEGKEDQSGTMRRRSETMSTLIGGTPGSVEFEKMTGMGLNLEGGSGIVGVAF